MKLTSLIAALNLNTSSAHLPLPNVDITKDIIIIDDPVSLLDPHALYLGTPDQIVRFIQTYITDESKGYTFISSGNSPALSANLQNNNINLIITEIPTIQLYNQVNRIHNTILHTVYKMQQYTINNKKIDAFLPLMTETIHGCIFILNSGFKVVLSECSLLHNADISFSPQNDAICCELLTHQYLAENAITYLTTQALTPQYNKIYLRALRYKHQTTGYLLILFPENHQTELDCTIADYSVKFLSQAAGRFDAKYKKSEALHQFITNLLERKINSPQELEERMKIIGFTNRNLYCCMLIRPGQISELKFNYMFSRISSFFPQYIIDCYQNYILILLPTIHHADIPSIDTKGLTQYLTEYDAYAGISFPVRSMFSLPAVFKEAVDAIDLGVRFSTGTGSKRIFPYEEYFVYAIIHLCKNGDFNKYYRKSTGYLCHPAFVQLHRYDRTNNDNLKDVLYSYLTHNQSINQTAQALYMHRNTLMKKIQKIEDIMNRPLNDALLCQALLFSFQIIRYSEVVLGEEIELQDK